MFVTVFIRIVLTHSIKTETFIKLYAQIQYYILLSFSVTIFGYNIFFQTITVFAINQR